MVVPEPSRYQDISRKLVWGILIAWATFTSGMWFEFLLEIANAEVKVEVSDSQDTKELKGIDEEGDVRFTLPLFEIEGVQYFSAGVGIEEREAVYPPFNLKLVFVAGARAFLTSASVEIRNDDESMIVHIPIEHVTGPWLYVNLPPGPYTITGRYSDYPEITKRVSLREHETIKVVLRWPML